jgi:hypothetical protein
MKAYYPTADYATPPAFCQAPKVGMKSSVDIRKVIRRRIRHESDHGSVVGDVNAVVAANVGDKSTRTSVSSRQRVVSTSRASSRADDTDDSSGGVDERIRGAERD